MPALYNTRVLLCRCLLALSWTTDILFISPFVQTSLSYCVVTFAYWPFLRIFEKPAANMVLHRTPQFWFYQGPFTPSSWPGEPWLWIAASHVNMDQPSDSTERWRLSRGKAGEDVACLRSRCAFVPFRKQHNTWSFWLSPETSSFVSHQDLLDLSRFSLSMFSNSMIQTNSSPSQLRTLYVNMNNCLW